MSSLDSHHLFFQVSGSFMDISGLAKALHGPAFSDSFSHIPQITSSIRNFSSGKGVLYLNCPIAILPKAFEKGLTAPGELEEDNGRTVRVSISRVHLLDFNRKEELWDFCLDSQYGDSFSVSVLVICISCSFQEDCIKKKISLDSTYGLGKRAKSL